MKRLIILLTIAAGSLAAQSVRTGLPFLKYGMDARSIGMGETFTAVPGDEASLSYNPAAIAFDADRRFSLSHRQGFAETNGDRISGVLPGDGFTVGFSALSSAVEGIEVRLQPGDPLGTFDARTSAVAFGVGIPFSSDLSFGVTGKLLHEKIYIDEAGGYGVDAGLFYRATSTIDAGLSVTNLGSMGVMRSERTALPTTVRAGVSYRNSLIDDVKILGAAEFVKTLDDEGSHLHAGAELIYDKNVMLRVGYQSGYETHSITTGLGVESGILRFDYAFVPMTGAFLPNHTFSLSFRL